MTQLVVWNSLVMFNLQKSGYESINKGEVQIFDQVWKVEMICDYEHLTSQDGGVAKMNRGNIYYVLKKIGRWLEITDGKGDSCFVLSKYCRRDKQTVRDSAVHAETYTKIVKPAHIPEPRVTHIMVQPKEPLSDESDEELVSI